MSAATIAIKDAFYNAGYNLSLLPTRIELEVKSSIYAMKKIKEENKASKQVKKAEKEVEKEASKAEKETLKNAEKAFGSEVFSEARSEDIAKASEGDAMLKLKLVAKATATDKLLQFALYYMTNQNAVLVKLDDSEKEFVNGIAKYFGFGKIYESADVADLEVFDMSSDKYVTSGNYVISIKGDIIPRTKDDLIIHKISKRKEQLAKSTEAEPVKDDGNGIPKPAFINDEEVVHPVTFTTNVPLEEAPIQGVGISDELFKKLEEAFDPFLKDTKHRYELMNDHLITLFVKRNSSGIEIEESYMVDPGVVMGKDKVYVLANLPNKDTIFVPLEKAEIANNVLSNAFYVLTPDEYRLVIQDYFRNMNIYRYLDMSNTGFLNNISDEEFQKLGKKLTFIIGQVASQSTEGQMLPRFRFNSWESVDNFMIISDPTVKSPLSANGTTSPVIVEGLMFIVEGDKVTQRLKTSVIETTIDKYGDM